MEFVRQDGTVRLFLLTTDQALFPEVGAWPDDNIEAADVIAKIAGTVYGGTKTVTQQTDIGLHLITLDCDGVASGSVIELSGEYYIDSVRYAWSEQVFVDPSVAVQDSIDSDWTTVFEDDVWKGRTTKRGTSTLVIPDKTLKQSDGSDVIDIDTQGIAGFVEE